MKIGDLYGCNLGRGILVVTDILNESEFEISNHKGTWIQKDYDIGKILKKIEPSNSSSYYDYLKQEDYKLKLLSMYNQDILDEEIALLRKLYGIVNAEITEISKNIDLSSTTKSTSDFKDDTDPNTLLEYSAKRSSVLKEISMSCYFARIDLEINNSAENYYIGKNTYKNNFLNIIDWRSEIAQYYYIKAQNKFSTGKEEIIVNQRFEYIIEDFILKKLNISFLELSTEINGKGVVFDPFLVSVLKDRRRSKELEDIIMTIQNKQYEILSHDPKGSFLVQGCAGSGKTMILLHRISYLLFNKLYEEKDILTITPNRNFYHLLENLMNNLEIKNVDTVTIYDYLSKACKYYFGDNNRFFYPYALDKMNFIGIINELTKHVNNYFSLEIGSILDSNMRTISDFYELNFKGNLEGSYYQRINDIKSSINQFLEEDKIFYEKVDINADSVINFTNNKCKENEKRILENKGFNLKIQKEIGNLTQEINMLNSDILSKQNECSELKDSVSNIRDQERLLIEEIENIKDFISSLNNDLENIENQLHKDKERVSVLKEELIRKELFYKVSTNRVVRAITSDSIKDKIYKAFIDIKVQIKSLEENIDNYVGIKETKKSEIIQTEETFLIKSNELGILINIREDETLKVEEKNDSISRLMDDKLKVIEKVDALKSSVSLYEKEIEMLGNDIIKDRVRVDKISFLRTKIIDRDFDYADGINYIDELNTQFSGRKKNKERKLLTKDHYIYLTKKLEAIDRIATIESLVKIFREDNNLCDDEDKQTILRLKLIAAVIYKGPYENKKLVLIDESQDYSLIDLKFMNILNGGKDTYLNFFGDSQQNILSNNNDNWDDLLKLFNVKVFILNENYRNSIEITDYYNSKVDRNDLSIGISEEKVLEITSLEKAIKYLINTKYYRKVIIIKSTESPITARILQLLQEKARIISDFDRIDFNKINIMAIQDVKGMEFDTVLVINNELTRNERYIALTRALHKLIVLDYETIIH